MREAHVAFVTLGCKVNQAESEAIARALGVGVPAGRPAEADIVVINTCTVTGEADRKARKAVRHALGLPLAPVVVVTGCLASLDAPALQALGERVVVEADKQRVAQRVREALESRERGRETREGERGRETREGERGRETSEDGPTGEAPVRRARVQLKIEDGCDALCSYCIVPYARGLPRPVPLAEVVAAAHSLAGEGVAEVVLTGINIGRYNDEGDTLPDVLEAVAATGIPRVRISSLEPGDVTGRLLEAARATSAFCEHLHLPLQSGSDEVLHRMGRPYGATGYAEVIERARHVFPGIAISTDIIVGFPGETDENFEETLAFVEEQAFSRLHVFRYSARRGTPASELPSQVAAQVKAARSAQLRALGDRLSAEYVAARIGTHAELLVERVFPGPEGQLSAEGTTRQYLRLRTSAHTPHERLHPGALLRVRVELSDGEGEARARVIG